MLRTVIMIIAGALSTSSVAGEPCKIASDRLLAIAKEAAGTMCETPNACRFLLLEKERPSHCAVVVTPVSRNEFGLEQAPMPGNFVVIEISDAGKVVKKQGGA